MSRFIAILLASSLSFAACAHDHAVGRREVAAIQNDSPAISPWPWPLPNDAIQESGSFARGRGDEN
jgi:hypothetical protein